MPNPTQDRWPQIQSSSIDIKKIYDQINQKNNHSKWSAGDYTLGMVGDVGDLAKLVMAKQNLRTHSSVDIDKDIEHELVDILWSIIVISNELGIDLSKSVVVQLETLKNRVQKNLQN